MVGSAGQWGSPYRTTRTDGVTGSRAPRLLLGIRMGQVVFVMVGNVGPAVAFSRTKRAEGSICREWVKPLRTTEPTFLANPAQLQRQARMTFPRSNTSFGRKGLCRVILIISGCTSKACMSADMKS